jgi:hypothetical protein
MTIKLQELSMGTVSVNSDHKELINNILTLNFKYHIPLDFPNTL